METKLHKNHLVITIPLEDPHPSATGKTLIVASSHGVKKTGVRVKGQMICVVANAFVYPNTPALKQKGHATKQVR